MLTDFNDIWWECTWLYLQQNHMHCNMLGLRKPLFCVVKDELFTPEDELSWADGQK